MIRRDNVLQKIKELEADLAALKNRTDQDQVAGKEKEDEIIKRISHLTYLMDDSAS